MIHYFIYPFAVSIVIAIIGIFINIALWARRGNRGIVITAVTVLGGLMAPDPNFEKQLLVIHEERDNKGSEDGTGDPPET